MINPHVSAENKNYLCITDSSIVSVFSALPDKSIDMEQLKEHYRKFPERWNTAFRFLAEMNTTNLQLGRTDLSEDVYFSYSEYSTEKSEDRYYESHKQYIDIQYLISGKEYIGITRDKNLKIFKPYNKEKDIVFYEYHGGEMLFADHQRYFIFFPDDIHKPCIQAGEKSQVKKIVIKIKIN